MRVRIRWTAWVCLALLFVAAAPFAAPALTSVAQAQDKTLVWENFDVDIQVNSSRNQSLTNHAVFVAVVSIYLAKPILYLFPIFLQV